MNAAQLPRIHDAIVIGSGAGGAAAAATLVEAGLDVLLLEKGGELPRDGSTLDFRAVVGEGRFLSREIWNDGAGRDFAPEEHFNVGGKTAWYGAALLRYSPEEFSADPRHLCPAWPLPYEALAPYYERAERRLCVRHFECEPDLARIVARLAGPQGPWRPEPLPMGLAPEILEHALEARHFDGFASVAGLKADARRAFIGDIERRANFRLVCDAEVSALRADPLHPRCVNGVRLADGREFRARAVLLAAGALHSPRLLQRHVESHALSALVPGSALIGRNLKLHLLTAMVALAPGRQRDLLRKTTVLLHAQMPHSSVQPLGFDAELIATLMPTLLPRIAARAIAQRAYGFFLQTEDGSHPDNRVYDRSDGFGHVAGKPMLDYDAHRLGPALAEHQRLVRELRRGLARAGLLAFSRRIGLAGTAHACGTLIAGTDPRSSVVAADGGVHGMSGLYVVDGSVLPRSSRVNPSLTIYAWAMRVAERLARQLREARTAAAAGAVS